MGKLLTLSFFLSFLLLFSCGGGGGGGGGTAGGAGVDRGDFKIGSFTDQALQQAFQEIAQQLNAAIALNKDITIHGVDCGPQIGANAFYSPQSSEIVMCNELLADMVRFFSGQVGDAQTAAVYAVMAYLAVFGHETGHALHDNLDLPVLGRAEDIADLIAVVLLIESAPDQQARQTNAMAAVLMGIYLSNNSSIPYGQHSPGPVRLSNIICWAAGGEPSILQNQFIAAFYQQMLRVGRDCEREYEEQKGVLRRTLGKYLKEEL